MEIVHETLKRMESLLAAEKVIVQDQLTKLKNQITELSNPLQKARGRKDHFKALWKQKEKEKLKAQKKYDSLSRKLDEEEASIKLEADNVRQTSKKVMQKWKEDIERLQKIIMELSLKADRLAVFQDIVSETPDLKPESECIMCMSNEISVLFIPCAHQVLCGQCNAVHEKHGMTNCPCCRTPIQKRVSVTYRTD